MNPLSVSLWLLSATTTATLAFIPSPPRAALKRVDTFPQIRAATGDDGGGGDGDDNSDEENPYADPNYPDLEFVNYDDPEYSVDQGVTDEMYDDTDERIDEMREDRRRRNDEFQFETYSLKVLKNGEEYFGDWEVYKTSTFLESVDDLEEGYPRVIRGRDTLKVKSRGYKIKVDTDSEFRVDGERICHEEIGEPLEGASVEALKMQEEILSNTYWPDQMSAFDFRGHQGNMCVGNAHTICAGVPLAEEAEEESDAFTGPFSEMRTEVGIWDEDIRMRVKFDYSVLEDEKQAYLKDTESTVPPPLRLKSMVICREAKGRWPQNGKDSTSEEEMLEGEALFGIPGAPGGLYDPPPVGSDAQAAQYMMLDLDGGATTLFPFLIDQDPEAYSGFGWVTSLDWTPANMRFQVDRKVQSGTNLLGLRTLELSEVQKSSADKYRPRDGGMDMRQ